MRQREVRSLRTVADAVAASMPAIIYRQPADAADAAAGSDDDDDYDPDPAGRPAFAVAGEPTADPRVPPSDGLEYLRRVRKEASALPAVTTRAAATSSTPPRPSPASRFALPPPLPPPSPGARPTAEWAAACAADFERLRRQLRTCRDASAPPAAMRLPHAADTDAWEVFCLGSRARDDDGGGATASSAGRPPLLSTLLALDQRDAAAVLQVLVGRLERDESGGPTAEHGRWLFALMARLEREVSADAAATLRALVRACAVRRADPSLRAALDASGGATRAEALRRAATLNVLVAIAGGFFGQASAEELRGEEELRGDDEGAPEDDGDSSLIYEDAE